MSTSKRKTRIAVLFTALVAVVILLLGTPLSDLFVNVADAHMGHEHPQIGGPSRPKTVPQGPHGRVRISGDHAGTAAVRLVRASDGSFSSGFELANVGDGPLRIYRVGVLIDDAGQAHAPGGISVQIVPGSTPLLDPGETRLYTVVWRPDPSAPRELSGYLSVDTDAAGPGATTWDPSSIVALSADGRPTILHRLLTVAWLAPLLLTLLALFGFKRAAGSARMLHGAASVVAALSAVVSVLPLATLVHGFGRANGNDGLQHLERAHLFGPVEYYLGVDGISAVLLAALGVAVFAIVLALPTTHPGTRGTLACAGVLTSAAALVLVSQSVALVLFGYVIATVAVSILGRRDVTRRLGAERRSAPGTVFAGVVGSIALAIATFTIARASGGGLLADGSDTPTALSIPELTSAAAHGHGLHIDTGSTLLGLPLEHGIAVLILTAAFALAPGMPLASWLSDLVREHEASVGALVTAVTSVVSCAIMLRVLVPIVPSAARWAASGVLVLGATTALVASLSAFFARDATRALGELAVASGGIALAAPLSLTVQGLTGAVAFALVRSLALPMLLLVVGAIVSRAGEARFSRLGGLTKTAPWLAALLALSLVGAGLLPGGGGFWAACLTIDGWVGQSPHLALFLVLAMLATFVAYARVARLAVGAPPASLRARPSLEPHGGRVPDVFRSERGWLIVFALAVLVLALLPRLVLAPTAPAALDLFRSLDAPGPTQVS